MSRISFPPYLIASILAFLPASMGSSAPSSLPQVDFGKMGTVGLGGSFSGLDWYSSSSSSSSSSSFSSSTATTFSTDGDTLFYQSTDGTFQALASTSVGGIINSICWSNTTSSTKGTLYIGGSFTSLSGTAANNVASFSLSDNTVSALSSGVSGLVNTVYCDNVNNEVWFGGSFTAPSRSGGNVALWSTSSNNWQTPEFGGFNGPVQSISTSTYGSSIYFGGDFTTSFASNTSALINSTSSTNGTSSIGSAPANTSTVGNSGYLTPLTIQASSDQGNYFTIEAGPSTNQSEYSNTDVLLCPGSGVWLAEDDTISNVNLVGEGYLPATGVRMVNGLVEGRGATNFCFTALPDYTQLNMTYTDPTTGKNATCFSHCPIYTDSSIGAQDYIFTDGARNMTGFEIQLKGWIGDGAGLSSVSMLTDGSYATAATAPNTASSCSNSNSSSVQSSGDWKTRKISTDSGITNYYLQSSVSINNPTYPSVTFYPDVSSSATYDVYIFIPGCTSTDDCHSRTSVDVEVFPLQGGLGWTSTISEQVQYDTTTLVYSGPVDASSSSFTPTIILALASNPAAVASGSKYSVVADRVQLTLTGLSNSTTTSSTSGTSTSTTGTNGTIITNSTMQTNSSVTVSYGVFEWVRSSTIDTDAASSYLSNNTETALTRLGFSLDAALNASGSSASSWTVNTIVSLDNSVFVGGDFSASNNYTNVLSIDTTSGQASALASQGLSGVVNSAAVVDGYVFFGGDFTSTAASGGVSLDYVARYDPKSKAWAALGGGVNGYVTDLLASPSSSTQLIVLGNFTNVIAANGTSSSSGGYAVWDTSSSTWASTGVVFGNVSAGAASSSDTYFAGKVYGSSSNSVSGVAMLTTGDDGSATISSLNGVSFGSTGSAPFSSVSTRKRSVHNSHSFTRSWISRFTDAMVERAIPVLSSRATAPSISSVPATAPAVLAGTFWTNTSASGKPTITILGGNFTSGSGSDELEGVAFYSSAASGLTGPSPAVSGVVKALNVVGHDVYVGGQGVSVQGVGEGLVVYDLQSGSWMTGGMPSLGASGSNVTVNAIRTRTNTNTVVVAGSFDTAGSLTCNAVCLWDSTNAQWSTPGSGLSSGEVRSIDFAGSSYELLVVAGSFVMSTGDIAYVATYSFDNSSWVALGSLPGPALAVAVDDKNATNIFAAGYSSSDGTPYLQRWDGSTWSAQNETYLESGSIIQQLAFVPMSAEHTAEGSIEHDRMLMVSGDLYTEDNGNVTSALYDGANWYPYLIASSSTGGLGSASTLFWSDSSFSYAVKHFLARGLVVLVAIAIATGLILLFVLLAFLLAYCTRRRERKNNATQREMYEKDDGGSDVSSTHQHVFNNVQAALEASLVGGGISAAAAARRSDPSSYEDYPIGSDGEDNDDDEEEEEEEGRETTMRYDFQGEELQEGELSMRAGQIVLILDDEQSHEWWYARDPATGREGVVPATYVW